MGPSGGIGVGSFLVNISQITIPSSSVLRSTSQSRNSTCCVWFSISSASLNSRHGIRIFLSLTSTEYGLLFDFSKPTKIVCIQRGLGNHNKIAVLEVALMESCLMLSGLSNNSVAGNESSSVRFHHILSIIIPTITFCLSHLISQSVTSHAG